MVSGVLMFGVFNWALGFGLAVALAQLPRLGTWRVARREVVHAAPEPHTRSIVEQAVVVAPTPQAAEPEVDAVVELPTGWINALEKEAVVAGSFVEASVQVLRLEVGKYRERLVTIDDELRAIAAPSSEQLQAICDELREVNVDWLARQADAAKHLSTRRGNLGSFEEAGHELENVLLDQAAQIETTLSNLQVLDFTTDVEAGRRKLVRELCRLVDLAHVLRDRMSDSLLAIMVAEGKIDAIDKKFQNDSATGLSNRFGLEVLLDSWWRDDASRQRLVSCVLVDVDRLHKLNEKHGPRKIDTLLAGFGRWVDDLVRRDRGFDRVARIAGQSFLLFLGDTGPRNATSAAERLRQALAAATFELDETVLELTASLGVVEIGKKDTSATLVRHLQQTLRLAKQNNRNCTALDEGSGATVVEPPQFQVKAKVVKLR